MIGRLLIAAAGFALLGSVAMPRAHAQAADWSKIVVAAKAEGKVVIYGSPVPATMARISADFEKANPGIVVEYHRMIGASFFNKMEQDRKGQVDGADATVTPEVAWLEDAAKDGALRPLAAPSAKGWPSSHMLGGMAPVLAVAPYVLAYNVNIVKSPVTGYRDLLRPEFKGRVGVPDPTAEAQVAFYDWLEKTQGADFLLQLAAQSPRIYSGSIPMTQSAAAGEIAVTSSTVLDLVNPLIAQGAPLKTVVPAASIGFAYAGAVVGWAKRPNAAQVYLDYLMSPRGQVIWHGRGESASPLPNVAGSLDVKTIALYDRKLYPVEVLTAYRQKWNKLFRPQ